MESILGDTMELARRRIDELHVRVSLPDGSTRVTVDEAEMQTIFFNLLDNSLHWLEKVPPEEREIVVQIARDSEALRVTFSDSGPGVPESQRDQIFLPYFSAKPDGVGLGLSLAGETAAEYDGGLELIADGPLHGATFLLTLRTRISGDE
jgi:signal transduction histidine kinase